MSTPLRRLIRGAAIAAIYTCLCLLLAPFSFQMVQVRVSEALTVLPFLWPEAIPGLFVGCLLSNLLAGAPLLDIVVGSLCTLGAALLTRYCRSAYLAPLPPVLCNAFGVGYVLYAAYGVPSYWLAAGSVGLGQLVACYGVGLPLLLLARKRFTTL